MIDVHLPETESILGTFREWQSEHESLASQLSESISALAAYQSHLDAWQQQLARERDELLTSREELETERAAVEQAQFELQQSSAEAGAELGAAREKIAELSTSLLDRTEQLRVAEQRRAESATELEQMRAREKELCSVLDEQKQTLVTERARWAEEAQQLREELERRPGAGTTSNGAPDTYEQSAAPRPVPQNQNSDQAGESPVLGSIMQQFGKLRQQRATDREAMRKAR
jgi:chromosome segregation ATPase